MDLLPDEIILRLFDEFDYSDLVEFCQLNKRLQRLFQDDIYWRHRLASDYNINIDNFNLDKKSDKSAFALYKELDDNGILPGEDIGYYPVYHDDQLIDWVYLKPEHTAAHVIKKIINIINKNRSVVYMNRLSITLGSNLWVMDYGIDHFPDNAARQRRLEFYSDTTIVHEIKKMDCIRIDDSIKLKSGNRPMWYGIRGLFNPI